MRDQEKELLNTEATKAPAPFEIIYAEDANLVPEDDSNGNP
jgi:hypothetical protein